MGFAAAVIITPVEGKRSLVQVDEVIPSADPHIAEYTGLIIGLKKAIEMEISRLNIRGDDQVIIYQCLNRYHPRHPPQHSSYLQYSQEVRHLLSSFKFYSLKWIPREKNRLSDRAAFNCFKNYQKAHAQ